MGRLLWGFILLFAITVSCGEGPRTMEFFPTLVPAPPVDISSVTSIPIGKSEVGTIDPGGDVHFFSFAAEQGTTYIFETFLTSLEDSRLYLYDPKRLPIGVKDLWDDRKGSKIQWTAPDAGTYYIGLTGSNDSQSGVYSLEVSVDRP